MSDCTDLFVPQLPWCREITAVSDVVSNLVASQKQSSHNSIFYRISKNVFFTFLCFFISQNSIKRTTCRRLLKHWSLASLTFALLMHEISRTKPRFPWVSRGTQLQTSTKWFGSKPAVSSKVDRQKRERAWGKKVPFWKLSSQPRVWHHYLDHPTQNPSRHHIMFEGRQGSEDGFNERSHRTRRVLTLYDAIIGAWNRITDELNSI